ncbi:MAG: hypothetical protein IT223_07560 [Crocinitomicaceae bacterium]|nr:hypothetical protein [Crocinitomicaceae bacterium]
MLLMVRQCSMFLLKYSIIDSTCSSRSNYFEYPFESKSGHISVSLQSATLGDVVRGYYYWGGNKWESLKVSAASSTRGFHEGWDNVTAVTLGNIYSSPNTVQVRKNFYITNYYSYGSGPEMLEVNGASVYGYRPKKAVFHCINRSLQEREILLRQRILLL